MHYSSTWRRGLGSDPSAREREVLQLIAEGNTNAQIAKKLRISRRTMAWHRVNASSKLGVYSPADLVRFAVQHRLFATAPD